MSERKKESRAARVPEQGRRATVTFRCLPVVQSQIQTAAENSGRSMSEEIERRVEGSFSGIDISDIRTQSLVTNIIQLIEMVERGTKAKWWEDGTTAGMCGEVIRELLFNLMPPAPQSNNKLLALVEDENARLKREAQEALWQTKIKLDAMDRTLAILRGDDGASRPEESTVDKLSQ